MKFNNLTEADVDYIKSVYDSALSRGDVEIQIAEKFNVKARTVRRWIAKLKLKEGRRESRILVYDLETPRLKAWVWWSGKQYVHDIIDEPKIISVSWKWVGHPEVKSLHWDLKTKDDKYLVAKFIDEYNKADLIVGINNKNFDDRWLRARAYKHGYTMNAYARTLDVQKEAKRLIRIPSYSMKNLAKYFQLDNQKLSHEGIDMWMKIQEGSMMERKEYMKKMIEYNVGDILTTEEIYFKLLPMMRHQAHIGVIDGNTKSSCPACGNTDAVKKFKTTVTNAGTIQHIMRCDNDGHQFKVSHTEYIKWLNG